MLDDVDMNNINGDNDIMRELDDLLEDQNQLPEIF